MSLETSGTKIVRTQKQREKKQQQQEEGRLYKHRCSSLWYHRPSCGTCCHQSESWHVISSSVFVCLLADLRSAWRTPHRLQLQQQSLQHPPSPRWCSSTYPTHTHLQPTSPAATPSMLPSSPAPETGWGYLKWGNDNKPAVIPVRWIKDSHCEFFLSFSFLAQVGWSTTKDYHTFVWVEPCLDVVGQQTKSRQAVFRGEMWFHFHSWLMVFGYVLFWQHDRNVECVNM